jgi:predicted nucleic acid-binding protein
LRGLFAVTERHPLSAGDAEFVALAEILGVPLVTEDRAILKCWPGRALSLDVAMCIQ